VGGLGVRPGASVTFAAAATRGCAVARSMAATTARSTAARSGFSMVELVVALTLFSVGILGLASAAVLAQRQLAAADAIERSARAAAAVLDSLVLEPSLADGRSSQHGATVRWTVAVDSFLTTIVADVEVGDGVHTRRVEFRASQLHDLVR
jgi:prepilin-type N-terminal cleavage/methylation domain-containing protein